MDFRSNLNILPDNDSPSRMAPLSHLPSVLSFDKPSCPTTHISANARFNSVIDSQCRRMLSPHPCFYNRTPRLSPHPNPRNNRKLTAIFTHHLPAKFTFRADPLQKALRGTLVSKVNFAGWGNPCQKYLRDRLGRLVKFTFGADPLQNALWGRLLFEVNFTGWGYPCQKCFKGRFDNLVKFTFWADPLQNAFWVRLSFEVERLCIHLEALPPSQVLQRHIVFRGECHRSRLPLPEVLQRPIRRYREIHLRDGPPPEGLQRHIASRGEFHDSRLPLSEVLQRPIRRSREIHLSRRPPSEGLLGQVVSRGGTTLYPPQSLTPSTGPSEAH